MVKGSAIPIIQEKDELRQIYESIIKIAQSVVVYRCAPFQKAETIKMVQKSLNNPVTLAVGDGNNDVNMITQASVGFGIQGNEGNAASQAADISVTKFKDVRRMIF